jgi:hypothetical protein
MKQFLFFGILVMLLVFVACKRSAEEAAPQGIALYETEEFKNFHQQFSTDSAFQMEHIVFPLDGIRAPSDQNDTLGLKHQWQREDWKIHGVFDDANGTFTVEMLDLAGKMVIEIISDESGLFTMERRFAKLSDGWNLIYYKEMGKYK